MRHLAAPQPQLALIFIWGNCRISWNGISNARVCIARPWRPQILSLMIMIFYNDDISLTALTANLQLPWCKILHGRMKQAIYCYSINNSVTDVVKQSEGAINGSFQTCIMDLIYLILIVDTAPQPGPRQQLSTKPTSDKHLQKVRLSCGKNICYKQAKRRGSVQRQLDLRKAAPAMARASDVSWQGDRAGQGVEQSTTCENQEPWCKIPGGGQWCPDKAFRAWHKGQDCGRFWKLG